jgi:Acyl-CoA carboxylase epsilon subunit
VNAGPDPVESVETPLLRILTPGATDEEVAALVAVVSAMAAAGAEERTRRPSPAWSAPARRLRTTLRPGCGAWRSSGLP